LFSDSKIVYSIYDDAFDEPFRPGFEKKMKVPGVGAKDLKPFKEANYLTLTKAAIDYADGLIIGSEHIHPEIEAYLKTCKKPVLPYQGDENYAQAYNQFYDRFLQDKK
jgi:starch synthase